MKEFLQAILQDNPNNARTAGLKIPDLIEVYEQSVEIMSLNEEVSLCSPADSAAA